MNNRIFFYFLITCYITSIFIGCKSTTKVLIQKENLRKRTTSGKVINSNFISIENEEFKEDKSRTTSEIYFKDSNVIFVFKRLIIYSLDDVEIERKDSIIGFTFNRLGTDKYFFYLSFSDTAKPQTIFQMEDTAYFPFGGSWNFKRGFQPSLVENSNFSNPIDTTLDESKNGNLNSINYKLLYGRLKNNPWGKIVSLVYLKSDLIPSYFTFDNNLTKMYGMPVTRVDFLDAGRGPNNEKISWSTRVWLEKNNLTFEEHKVFEAWIKNASNHYDSIPKKP